MFLSKPAFVAALLTSNALALPSSHPTFQNHSKTDNHVSFDYIVVGSGPGGGPLAVNLAEAGYSVLLLEAGRNHTTDSS
ncbi:hypothetical protein TOPH_04423 [Tolypocladium ophioglossoides CBS 100239]|uniref:FAD-dependent oxidoreductase 2 FAD-binding domain-containing protein n=1 Tax=Tolypocladium ophioglossoides (strain CBS 100239) TaxID=1163406 RepID=A0A0L0NBB2_TOLOC|nr:hypothetical protein TOPH_04423 [Tolypocladium ophioglossoides CBS 100239]